MATINIRPVEQPNQIQVNIEIIFNEAELGKEYLIKGSVKVFEGRLNLLSTLMLNDIKIKASNTKPILLSQQFPEPHHGFQLRFELEHSLYLKL